MRSNAILDLTHFHCVDQTSSSQRFNNTRPRSWRHTFRLIGLFRLAVMPCLEENTFSLVTEFKFFGDRVKCAEVLSVFDTCLQISMTSMSVWEVLDVHKTCEMFSTRGLFLQVIKSVWIYTSRSVLVSWQVCSCCQQRETMLNHNNVQTNDSEWSVFCCWRHIKCQTEIHLSLRKRLMTNTNVQGKENQNKLKMKSWCNVEMSGQFFHFSNTSWPLSFQCNYMHLNKAIFSMLCIYVALTLLNPYNP